MGTNYWLTCWEQKISFGRQNFVKNLVKVQRRLKVPDINFRYHERAKLSESVNTNTSNLSKYQYYLLVSVLADTTNIIGTFKNV